MIKCTTVGIKPSKMCYEICILAYKCGALKEWKRIGQRWRFKMTREMAIQVLQTALTAPFIYGEYAEALDMAIEALSADAKGDLISRQWLLDLYTTPIDGEDVEWKVPLEVVRQNILDAPSADRPIGKWIRVGYDIYECSLCRQNVMTKDIDCYSYCHRCGAKMEGGGEE